MVCWRSRNMSVFRTGICSQRLSIRLPIGVTVQSSTAARVFSTPPAVFWVISRLRRVAASIMMLSCWRSIVMERICGREVRWVSLRTVTGSLPHIIHARHFRRRNRPDPAYRTADLTAGGRYQSQTPTTGDGADPGVPLLTPFQQNLRHTTVRRDWCAAALRPSFHGRRVRSDESARS